MGFGLGQEALAQRCCQQGRGEAAWRPPHAFPDLSYIIANAATMSARMVAAAAAHSHVVLAQRAASAAPATARSAVAVMQSNGRRHAGGIALQQQQQPPQRQQRHAAAAGLSRRRQRHVAVSVAAPVAEGPTSSAQYGTEVLAAVDAVRLASRLCQVRL